MKGKLQDGGPFHSVEVYNDTDEAVVVLGIVGDPDTRTQFTGITMRQHFAGQAMQGMVSSIVRGEEYDRMRHWAQLEGLTVSQWIARDSFKQADAMLAESDKDSTLESVTKERDELRNAVLAWWEISCDDMAAAAERLQFEEPAFVTAALAIGEQP